MRENVLVDVLKIQYDSDTTATPDWQSLMAEKESITREEECIRRQYRNMGATTWVRWTASDVFQPHNNKPTVGSPKETSRATHRLPREPYSIVLQARLKEIRHASFGSATSECNRKDTSGSK